MGRRARPRHDTTRTLSVLTLGCALLATPRHAPCAWRTLVRLLRTLTGGAGVVLSFRPAPQPLSVPRGRAPPSSPTGTLRVARFARVSFPRFDARPEHALASLQPKPGCRSRRVGRSAAAGRHPSSPPSESGRGPEQDPS